VRLFIDECLSPPLAVRPNDGGRHDAIHPLHVGRRGEADHRVLARCIEEDRVLVTENAGDFRRLVGRVPSHPGLILLPAIDREGSWSLLEGAIAFLDAQGDPMSLMVNHVLEVEENGVLDLRPLPAPAAGPTTPRRRR
jgi:predicted nuclease of predicted toxin-antitoxin system